MATANPEIALEEKTEGVSLEGGTYEIIRKRLETQAENLRVRLQKLNEARKEVFGAIETKLIATNRIATENNCLPQDMVALGPLFIFGYNVQVRLKSIELADVFSVFRYESQDHSFHPAPLDLIAHEKFVQDFLEMYKFYKDTVFMKFAVLGPHLYMVFQVGKKIEDIKVFKWTIVGKKLEYVNNRSEYEFKYPEQHAFGWQRARREAYREGRHPHISIQDRVFVEAIGGDLTIKIEDNTESGEGIYSEPVERKQGLDDGEYYFADLGNLIILKIRPYQEQNFRYFVFNDKLKQVVRIDKIGEACILLPDQQGLIFSNGYYLQSGELKVFSNLVDHLKFEKHIQAPNGEDHLFVFFNEIEGIYVLLPYNLIEQKVENPIVCNGFSLFEGGEMAYFRAQLEPTKTHAVQIWQTPYVGADYVPPIEKDNFLFKIGNKDIVRGMAALTEILNLIAKPDVYAALYLDLVRMSTAALDGFYWLNHPEAFQVNEPLIDIRQSASAAIEEFEKVTRVKKNTAAQIEATQKKIETLQEQIKRSNFDKIDQFVQTLAALRELRGEVIALKDLRYTNLPQIASFEQLLAEKTQSISQDTVRFLLKDTALDFYRQQVSQHEAAIEKGTKVAELNQAEAAIAQTGQSLDLLIDIVSNLKIEDATQTTQIIDRVSAIYTTLNQAKAQARQKKKSLRSGEALAEFNAQIKLIGQGVINYLDIADTPEKADEFLTKLLVQLEELEGKFSDFDEFIGQLAEKREEIYNAFESKKLNLIEARNKRANALQQAADRILKGIRGRVATFTTINEINGYFAGDLMIEKIRDLVQKLVDLGDSVKADEIQSRLKSLREDTVRQLKDKQEMFVGGENVIKFGKHHFSVNTQNLDLTTILRNGKLYYHLTGTNFFQEIEDPALNETASVWEQEVVSENQQVYRAEYLAYRIYQFLSAPLLKNGAKTVPENLSPLKLEEAASLPEDQLAAWVQQFMASRYAEAYTKGVHDIDAAKILQGLARLNQSIDLLRYPTTARACAAYYWKAYLPQFSDKHRILQNQLRGIGLIRRVFPDSKDYQSEIGELIKAIGDFIEDTQLFPIEIASLAGEYLFYEMTRGEAFIISPEAAQIYEAFQKYLHQSKQQKVYEQSLLNLREVPQEQFELLRIWVEAFVKQANMGEKLEFVEEYLDEAASLLFHQSFDNKQIVRAPIAAEIKDLAGTHPVIQDKCYFLHYNDFMLKLNGFARQVVPLFEKYTARKKALLEAFREQLRLEEFRPRVLSSFVRNRLINEVYLPLIGNNLAKQIGVVGENKRTDLMGMLLLISPPGYGKTTLMEYISSRLGIIFMKINGPAIGHQVTSLDPAEAPNASAREEVKKLNLAFEMGDNVMIYLDDIQHCNPELLQKFISLCDGQRKIEGVYEGKPKTYDLRGRKVCVVMAGNPYTESGDKFQIPDMLANRADTYNLGDIIGNSEAAFKLSYIENCLTANPVLNKLAARSQKDVYALVRLAETDSREGLELEGNYSGEEINEIVAVLKKLLVVRNYVLRNNIEYIRSAAQSDEFRTEPPFKLQGSYRDMNKIAEKIVPIMNEEELLTVILSHYENEAQTLTTGAEANLLKFKEMNQLLRPEEAQRWENIKTTFRKNNQFRGLGTGEHMGQVLVQLANFSEGLFAIREELQKGIQENRPK